MRHKESNSYRSHRPMTFRGQDERCENDVVGLVPWACPLVLQPKSRPSGTKGLAESLFEAEEQSLLVL